MTLAFEDALKLLSDPYSYVMLITQKRPVVLLPKYIGDIKSGIVEQTSNEVNRFSESLNGVPIAFERKYKLLQNNATILNTGHLHFHIEVTLIVFKPQIGCVLKAVINKTSKNHIGCLVHKEFNASIPLESITRKSKKHKKDIEYSIGDEILLEVTEIETHSRILSFKGRIKQTDS